MFIDRNMTKKPVLFGGAELSWTGTPLDTIRSSERRWRVIGLGAINISLLPSEELVNQ
jgi:hypothetical protein